VSELRYHPWGGTRYTAGTTPTTRRFTGQIEDAAIGLYFYNARYYDPSLSRFISPDSIVPSPQNPQSLNRYSYVLNSPLRYTDPSGHFDVPIGECGELCQLLGFSDWDTFNSWWSTLAGLLDGKFQKMLIDAKWGDILSFTWDPETTGPSSIQNMAFVKDFGTDKLKFWNVDVGISVDFWNVEERWLAGYRQTGSAGELVPFNSPRHPWYADNILEKRVTIDNGNGEHIAFDNAYSSVKQAGFWATLGIGVAILGEYTDVPFAVDLGVALIDAALSFAELGGIMSDTTIPFVHSGSEEGWWLAQMQ